MESDNTIKTDSVITEMKWKLSLCNCHTHQSTYTLNKNGVDWHL